MSFISISERAYKYIRQFTIKSLDDAMIELITNCIDAYNKTSLIQRFIYIDVYDQNRVIVRDRALGLTSDELSQCFLQVGTYTSDSNSRGFFSRGAKDISALGNITFDAIKNNKYSQCILDTDAYGDITIQDVDATADIRNNLFVPDGNNGLNVTIDLLPNFQSINIDQLYAELTNMAVLRDINTDPKNIIYLRKFTNGDQIYSQQIQYIYPVATQILDIEYIVPNYPDETARFVIYKCNKPLSQPSSDSMMQFGFLIKDSTTIYEVNTLDNRFRWNPYINYLYGYIVCDGIKKYLLDYDANGTSANNPYPIIDPSRLTGVNKMHPLIQNILSIPLVRIDSILREMNNSISSKSVTIEDISDLMDELNKYGLQIIQTNDVKVNFLPSYDGKLAKAIVDDRANFVLYEKSYALAGEYKLEDAQIENYLQDQIIKNNLSTNNFYYLDAQNQLVEIQNQTPDQQNIPINIIDLLTTDQISELQNNPYVYKLSNNGTMAKLYIFQKGNLDTVISDSSAAVITKTRQFSIQFINDINLTVRYIIDNTNGVIIKLNLNNPMVAKYLTNKNIDSLDDLMSITVIKSTNSLMFLQDLIINILSDLVIQSDIQNRKLILDSDSYNNTQKILEYRNQVITKIEILVDSIFSKYIGKIVNDKIMSVNQHIDNIGQTIMDTMGTVGITDTSSFALLSETFKNTVGGLIE